jgi:hypothetical protein
MENKFVKWLLGLWDNSKDGASMRKVLAVWVMILVTALHRKYLAVQVTKEASDWDFAETLLYADYIVVMLLLGLIVAQDVLKLKFGGKEPPKIDEVNTPENEAPKQ